MATESDGMAQDLGKQMKSGALWVYLQGWLGAVLQFGAGLVLARLLAPSDFGAFYAVTAFTAVIQAQVQFGIPESLLQARELEDAQWNSAFWLMEGIAVGCTLLVLVSSGWLQGFYDDPRFTVIIRAMCVNFFILPYMSINGTLLRRRMDYKTASRIQLVASFGSIVVSIVLASLGLGPYSLLLSGIFSSLFSTVLMARKAPWRPRLAFSSVGLRPLVRFGWRLHLNNTLNMAAGRIDNMMVGSMIGTAGLGIYNRAYNLSRMPVTEISSRLYQLFFSGLSRIQDDLDYSVQMYKKILCAMSLAIFPFLALFVLAGDGVIAVLYGDKWLPAALPLRIMALGSFATVISTTMGALSDSQNLVARETPIQVLNAASTVAAVLAGSPWGLTGVSIGIALKSVLLLVFIQQMLQRSHVRLPLAVVAEGAGPAFVAAMAAFVAGLAVRLGASGWVPAASLGNLSLVTAAVLGTYGVMLLVLGRWLRQNRALQTNLQLFGEVWVRVKTKVGIVRPALI